MAKFVIVGLLCLLVGPLGMTVLILDVPIAGEMEDWAFAWRTVDASNPREFEKQSTAIGLLSIGGLFFGVYCFAQLGSEESRA